MKVVISCSAKKNGGVFQHGENSIHFVSRPHNAPINGDSYFHPDDLIPNKKSTWRELVELQEDRIDLIPAHKLYNPLIYENLFNQFNKKLYIFSAGWGIIRADYKLPKYDITFSQNTKIPVYSRRNHNDVFKDFNHLSNIEKAETILFIAGKDYVLPFCNMTAHLPSKKIIIYTSNAVLNNNPYVNNVSFEFNIYKTKTKTNWHYEFAKKLTKGELEY